MRISTESMYRVGKFMYSFQDNEQLYNPHGEPPAANLGSSRDKSPDSQELCSPGPDSRLRSQGALLGPHLCLCPGSERSGERILILHPEELYRVWGRFDVSDWYEDSVFVVPHQSGRRKGAALVCRCVLRDWDCQGPIRMLEQKRYHNSNF